VLRRVVEEARRTSGDTGFDATLTHPAGWGPARRAVLTGAAELAGLGRVRLVAEPTAAAVYFVEVLANRVPPGSAVVVHDLGAGTFDASVVCRTGTGFEVLAVDGRDNLGGLDLDSLILDQIVVARAGTGSETWTRLNAPESAEDRRNRRLLWDDVRLAKERLSRHSTADLVVPLVGADVHLTRDELEAVARPLVEATVRVTASVIRNSGVPADRIKGVFLVGGASRMPLVARLLHVRLGIPPTVIEQPELVVAEGAVLVDGELPALPKDPVAAAGPAALTPAVAGPAAAAAVELHAPATVGAVAVAVQAGSGSRVDRSARRPRPRAWLAGVAVLAVLLLTAAIAYILRPSPGTAGAPGASGTGSTTAAGDPARYRTVAGICARLDLAALRKLIGSPTGPSQSGSFDGGQFARTTCTLHLRGETADRGFGDFTAEFHVYHDVATARQDYEHIKAAAGRYSQPVAVSGLGDQAAWQTSTLDVHCLGCIADHERDTRFTVQVSNVILVVTVMAYDRKDAVGEYTPTLQQTVQGLLHALDSSPQPVSSS
jgi:hypothetical protein